MWFALTVYIFVRFIYIFYQSHTNTVQLFHDKYDEWIVYEYFENKFDFFNKENKPLLSEFIIVFG